MLISSIYSGVGEEPTIAQQRLSGVILLYGVTRNKNNDGLENRGQL